MYNHAVRPAAEAAVMTAYVDVLYSSAEHLRRLVSPLTEDQLASPAYPSEWLRLIEHCSHSYADVRLAPSSGSAT